MIENNEQQDGPAGGRFFTLEQLARLLEVELPELRKIERSGRLASFFYQGERHYSLDQVREVLRQQDAEK